MSIFIGQYSGGGSGEKTSFSQSHGIVAYNLQHTEDTKRGNLIIMHGYYIYSSLLHTQIQNPPFCVT